MNATDRLTELFMKFPGIGPKQAKRFVYFLLREHFHFKEQLINALQELKHTGKQCERCYSFFGDKPHYAQGSDGARYLENPKSKCSICLNENRDGKVLMIVEKELDLDAIEKTGSYNGRYFILGGILPPLTEKPSELIRVRELVSRVYEDILNNNLEEIIFALPVTDYGDTTKEYLEKTLGQIVGIKNIKMSTLARGLSSGLELEYVDRDTFKSALDRRN